MPMYRGLSAGVPVIRKCRTFCSASMGEIFPEL